MRFVTENNRFERIHQQLLVSMCVSRYFKCTSYSSICKAISAVRNTLFNIRSVLVWQCLV